VKANTEKGTIPYTSLSIMFQKEGSKVTGLNDLLKRESANITSEKCKKDRESLTFFFK